MAMTVGEIVYLNSGSPPMTVIVPKADGTADVMWAIGSGLTTSNVPQSALTATNPASSAAVPVVVTAAGVAVSQQLTQLASSIEMQQRVSYAMSSAAVSVYSEASNTTGHAARAAFANKVTAGSYSIRDACLAVLTNSTIAAEANPAKVPGLGIPDADIQFAVNSIWNLLAGS